MNSQSAPLKITNIISFEHLFIPQFRQKAGLLSRNANPDVPDLISVKMHTCTNSMYLKPEPMSPSRLPTVVKLGRTNSNLSNLFCR